jgi:hypothetical protein
VNRLHRLKRFAVYAVLLSVIFGCVCFAAHEEHLNEMLKQADKSNVWAQYADLPDDYAETVAEPDGTFTVKINWWKNQGEDTLRDSLLHERAHILSGFEHGHDAVWQAEYERLLKEAK